MSTGVEVSGKDVYPKELFRFAPERAASVAGPAAGVVEGRNPVSEPFPSGISIVVPVCNEARILLDSLGRMHREFEALGVPFEMVICENGSTDGTLTLVEQLRLTYPSVRVERLPRANYGLALKQGISVAKYDVVTIFNIDFWNMDFVRTAIAELNRHDMVIGSKIMEGARDQRPVPRRLITRGFNRFLRLVFGFRGTDTHGMKAFRLPPVADIVPRCITGGSIFDSELVLRAERCGLRIIEVPVHVRELRQPSYWALVKRIPETVVNLARLWGALRAA